MKRVCRVCFLLSLLGFSALPLLPAIGVAPLFAATASKTSADVTVGVDKQWTDTGMDVVDGDKLHITAKGTVDFSDKTGVGPEGAPRGWKDTLRPLMLPSAGRGALVGYIGTQASATPFLVGADGTIMVPFSGRLYLGVNQDQYGKPTSGQFQVHIDRIPSSQATASGAAASASKYNFQPLFAILQKDLPARVTDSPSGNGNPGDLVNFVLVGSRDQVVNAFKAAGWLQADKSNQDAVVSALIATLKKDSYVTVPMSILYLFGRPQDFGYERTEPVMVVTTRDHFRIWQAPFSTPQQTIWAGAGTHDVGIERDQRTQNGITHKIDPDIDKERDFIGATLQQAGQVEAMDYMKRSNAITSTKTATGGEIKSDGRVLVIVLKPTQSTGK